MSNTNLKPALIMVAGMSAAGCLALDEFAKTRIDS